MARRRTEDIPVRRVAALGCRLPARLPAGEILVDIAKKQWRLGHSIGCGGFGDIYLASDDITRSVGADAKYVIKIEPHNNGPLFVEKNFYIRAARRHTIESWCRSQGKRKIGIPTYEGSGSHVYQNQRFRFLVIPRYDVDVGQLFLSSGRKLPLKLVNNLAVQMLDALEYIHSRGYAHADVKGSNILMRNETLFDDQAYLVDYGLAFRFRTGSGTHKPFMHDERRAHEGTLEFTSRDAHHGTHSRRGDLETLGYNIIQWLCGRLPWEQESGGMAVTADPENVHAQKERLFSDIPLSMQNCFSRKKKPPAAVTDYMKYIATLGFESKPNYSYLRNLFLQDDGEIRSLFIQRESIENMTCARSFRRPCLRERRPCKPVNGEIRITRNTQPPVPRIEKKFDWEAILARHPDKFAKVRLQPPPVTLTPPPSPPPSRPTSSQPTYAMLQVIQRMKERQSGTCKHKTITKSSDNELKPKWMTPAMEEIAQLKKRVTQLPQLSTCSTSTSSPRLTRYRVAQIKRLASKQNEAKTSSQHNGKLSQKKRKVT